MESILNVRRNLRGARGRGELGGFVGVLVEFVVMGFAEAVFWIWICDEGGFFEGDEHVVEYRFGWWVCHLSLCLFYLCQLKLTLCREGTSNPSIQFLHYSLCNLTEILGCSCRCLSIDIRVHRQLWIQTTRSRRLSFHTFPLSGTLSSHLWCSSRRRLRPFRFRIIPNNSLKRTLRRIRLFSAHFFCTKLTDSRFLG